MVRHYDIEIRRDGSYGVLKVTGRIRSIYSENWANIVAQYTGLFVSKPLNHRYHWFESRLGRIYGDFEISKNGILTSEGKPQIWVDDVEKIKAWEEEKKILEAGAKIVEYEKARAECPHYWHESAFNEIQRTDTPHSKKIYIWKIHENALKKWPGKGKEINVTHNFWKLRPVPKGTPP